MAHKDMNGQNQTQSKTSTNQEKFIKGIFRVFAYIRVVRGYI